MNDHDAKPACDQAIAEARGLLGRADRVLIGAGAGLSTAAGITYGGPRFEQRFRSFIERYGMTDMYSAGFYPFPTEEDRWAYWAEHVWANRYEPPALPLYESLFDFVRGKDYFVITTNVDAQFQKAGFASERLFATQGDYGLNQCQRGCHDRLYPNRDLVDAIRAATRNGEEIRAPSALVPRCPVCGGPMAVHLRVDGRFVEDAAWHEAEQRYRAFVAALAEKPEGSVLLELGVGWNTPVIIRFPFEQLAAATGAPLIRMNYDDARIDSRRIPHGVGLQGDLAALWPRVAK